MNADNTTVLSHLEMARSLQSRCEAAIVQRAAATLCRIRRTFEEGPAYTAFGGTWTDVAVLQCQLLDMRLPQLQQYARTLGPSIVVSNAQSVNPMDEALATSEDQDWVIVQRPSAPSR